MKHLNKRYGQSKVDLLIDQYKNDYGIKGRYSDSMAEYILFFPRGSNNKRVNKIRRFVKILSKKKIPIINFDLGRDMGGRNIFDVIILKTKNS